MQIKILEEKIAVAQVIYYGRLSAEKKEDHLKKQRIARQQKNTALSRGPLEESSQIADQGNNHRFLPYWHDVLPRI